VRWQSAAATPLSHAPEFFKLSNDIRPHESGVALRFPPQMFSGLQWAFS
jgi:hypothetical protein